MVDGSDVAAWGTLTAGRFRYAPGNLGAGVHTIAVTVADLSGNPVGPVMWQFAVAKIRSPQAKPIPHKQAVVPAVVAAESRAGVVPVWSRENKL
jgi:hypothetical protein